MSQQDFDPKQAQAAKVELEASLPTTAEMAAECELPEAPEGAKGSAEVAELARAACSAAILKAVEKGDFAKADEAFFSAQT